MKLWEIKASALKLMFADSDMQFSYKDFEDGVVYDNGNTREKLIGMNYSIRRAIDMYYYYCGVPSRKAKVKYAKDLEGNLTNKLDISGIEDFDIPGRIKLKADKAQHIKKNDNLEYYYDNVDNSIEVDFDDDYGIDLEKLEFELYYQTKQFNLPYGKEINDLTFDLDDLHIPTDVQMMIPLYIKGEIYEEDEVNIAMAAKQEYTQFLLSYRDKFSTIQTKVHNNFQRG